MALRVADLQRAVGFATAVLGMREVERRGAVSYLSCSARHHELMLIEDAAAALDHVAFEAAGATELAQLRARLAGGGWTELSEPTEAGIEDAVRFVGPGGFVFEIHSGMSTGDEITPRADAVNPHGIEHATLIVTDIAAMERFFVEMLGLAISDRVPGRISWLRCGERHHDFNLIKGEEDLFNHVAWEVAGLEQIGRAADLLAARGSNLLWGPGRHRPGHVLFAYFLDDEGVVNEFCADVEAVAADRPLKEWPDDPGTANSWGPTPGPDFFTHSIPLASRS
ncbi:MAG: VOC family protein [Actinobacteria bacterium]|nr:VOC family protein [Actinomycetota bacterium]